MTKWVWIDEEPTRTILALFSIGTVNEQHGARNSTPVVRGLTEQCGNVIPIISSGASP